jgi:hypothetical protein
MRPHFDEWQALVGTWYIIWPESDSKKTGYPGYFINSRSESVKNQILQGVHEKSGLFRVNHLAPRFIQQSANTYLLFF